MAEGNNIFEKQMIQYFSELEKDMYILFQEPQWTQTIKILKYTQWSVKDE